MSESFLSKQVVGQEKDASEAQEDTQHHSNTRATCRHAALLEEALIRRAGDTPRAQHLPSPGPPPLHTQKHTPPSAHMHTDKRTHTHMRMEGRGHAKGASPPPPHTQML